MWKEKKRKHGKRTNSLVLENNVIFLLLAGISEKGSI